MNSQPNNDASKFDNELYEELNDEALDRTAASNLTSLATFQCRGKFDISE